MVGPETFKPETLPLSNKERINFILEAAMYWKDNGLFRKHEAELSKFINTLKTLKGHIENDRNPSLEIFKYEVTEMYVAYKNWRRKLPPEQRSLFPES